MSILDWFKPKASSHHPESQWLVAVVGNAITSRDHTGDFRSISKNEIFGIVIETNVSGPWGADVWWLLFGENGKLVCGFPQGATGDEDAVKFLMQLEGFENAAMIEAMGSTDNATFVVWRRPPTQ